MRKILLVDDERDVLEDLEQHMDWKALEIGHVFTAESVKEAIALYDLYEPALIVSDIEMLGESGLDLLTKLRAKGADVKFLFLTCHPDFDYTREALRLGSDDYILKPVDYEELSDAIRRILGDSAGGPGAFSEDSVGSRDLTDRAKEYIREHLAHLESVSEVADALHCSESTLMKTFKKDTGWGVAEYVAKERIFNAGQLLKNTEWSISIIADQCGFKDQSYFSRVFKKVMDMTPNEYRKIKRQK